jgi:hypothetical protein
MEIVSQELIQVRFTVKDGDREFSDALYFTAAERAAIAAEDLEALKTQRFEAWKAIVEAPPAIAVPPTEEQVLADIVALEEQRATLDAELAAKNTTLAVIVAKADPLPIKIDPVLKG